MPRIDANGIKKHRNKLSVNQRRPLRKSFRDNTEYWLSCKKIRLSQRNKRAGRDRSRSRRERYVAFPTFGRPWLIDSKNFAAKNREALSQNLRLI